MVKKLIAFMAVISLLVVPATSQTTINLNTTDITADIRPLNDSEAVDTSSPLAATIELPSQYQDQGFNVTRYLWEIQNSTTFLSDTTDIYNVNEPAPTRYVSNSFDLAPGSTYEWNMYVEIENGTHKIVTPLGIPGEPSYRFTTSSQSSGIAGAIYNAFKPLIDLILIPVKATVDVLGSIVDILEEVYSAVSNLAGGIVNGLQSVIDSAVNFVVYAVNDFIDFVVSTTVNISFSIINVFTRFIGTVWASFEYLYALVMDYGLETYLMPAGGSPAVIADSLNRSSVGTTGNASITEAITSGYDVKVNYTMLDYYVDNSISIFNLTSSPLLTVRQTTDRNVSTRTDAYYVAPEYSKTGDTVVKCGNTSLEAGVDLDTPIYPGNNCVSDYLYGTAFVNGSTYQLADDAGFTSVVTDDGHTHGHRILVNEIYIDDYDTANISYSLFTFGAQSAWLRASSYVGGNNGQNYVTFLEETVQEDYKISIRENTSGSVIKSWHGDELVRSRYVDGLRDPYTVGVEYYPDITVNPAFNASITELEVVKSSSQSYSVKWYSLPDLPNGLSFLIVIITLVVSAIASFIAYILPDTVKNIISSFFGNLGEFVSAIVSGLNSIWGVFTYVFVDGLSTTIKLIKWAAYYKAAMYGLRIYRAWESPGESVGQAVEYVIDDMVHYANMLIGLVDTIMSASNDITHTVVSIINTIRGWIRGV